MTWQLRCLQTPGHWPCPLPQPRLCWTITLCREAIPDLPKRATSAPFRPSTSWIFPQRISQYLRLYYITISLISWVFALGQAAFQKLFTWFLLNHHQPKQGLERSRTCTLHSPHTKALNTQNEWVGLCTSVCVYVHIHSYTYILHCVFFHFFFYFSDALISGPFRTLEGLPRIVG